MAPHRRRRFACPPFVMSTAGHHWRTHDVRLIIYLSIYPFVHFVYSNEKGMETAGEMFAVLHVKFLSGRWRASSADPPKKELSFHFVLIYGTSFASPSAFLSSPFCPSVSLALSINHRILFCLYFIFAHGLLCRCCCCYYCTPSCGAFGRSLSSPPIITPLGLVNGWQNHTQLDVDEETETDLAMDKYPRVSKSKSPESWRSKSTDRKVSSKHALVFSGLEFLSCRV